MYFSPHHDCCQGGPYHDSLYDILGAYACYRPDIGYVQGMSFLAAVLLLNMDASDAFICLANLLNLTSYLAFFKVSHTLPVYQGPWGGGSPSILLSIVLLMVGGYFTGDWRFKLMFSYRGRLSELL